MNEHETATLQSHNVVQMDTQRFLSVFGDMELKKEESMVGFGVTRLYSTSHGLILGENPQTTEYEDTWFLRRVASMEQFDAFVAERKALYDRMWDGCGCKPKYMSPNHDMECFREAKKST